MCKMLYCPQGREFRGRHWRKSWKNFCCRDRGPTTGGVIRRQRCKHEPARQLTSIQHGLRSPLACWQVLAARGFSFQRGGPTHAMLRCAWLHLTGKRSRGILNWIRICATKTPRLSFGSTNETIGLERTKARRARAERNQSNSLLRFGPDAECQAKSGHAWRSAGARRLSASLVGEGAV